MAIVTTSFLETCGIGEGQTATVAEHVGFVLADRGHEVTTLPVADAPTVDVEDFDAVFVGSPVVDRQHLPAVIAFVERNREALADRPSAFFQLSLAAIASIRWARETDRAFVDDLVAETGWHPDRVGRFAGAVAYTQYDRLTRWSFELVSMVTTGDTETSRDYEYTDREAAERFATEFAVYAASSRGSTSAASRLTPDRYRRGVAGLALLGVALAGVVYWFVVRPRSDRREAAEPPVRRSTADPAAATPE